MSEDELSRAEQVGTTSSDMPSAPPIPGESLPSAPSGYGFTSSDTPAQRSKSPSGWWYLLALLIMGGGLLIGIIAGVTEGAKIGDNLVKAQGPGTATVQIKKSGRQSVYVETQGGSAKAVNPQITIRDSNEQSIPLSPSSGSVTYNINGRDGYRTAMVDIPAPGEYTVTSTSAGNFPFTLRIGSIGVGATLKAIFMPTMLGFLIGIAYIIALAIKRASSVRS